MLILSGWLTAVGWQVYLASVCFLVGTIIQGLLVLNDPTYVYQRWHGTLLAIAVVFFCIIFNTALASRLPMIGMFRLWLQELRHTDIRQREWF
jgi:amino acid transporter